MPRVSDWQEICTRVAMLDFEFAPCPDQAQQNNRLMHGALSDSVTYLAQALDEQGLAVDQDMAAAWAEQVSTNPQLRPSVFGGYYDLVSAVQAGDEAAARALLNEVIASQPAETPAAIYRLGQDYSETETDRFQRYMGNGRTGASGIDIPYDDDADRFEQLLHAAFAWIDREVPDLGKEFRTLIRDIILVSPDDSSPTIFEGGTSFKLWGALFLNAESEFTTSQLVTSLAHEEGHAALFGACRNEMLVENPDSELFWSPIRQTERPLEGIFHAAFVSARMLYVMQHQVADLSLPVQERQRATQDAEEAARIYTEGVEIVRENGRLTKTGTSVLATLDAQRDHLLNWA